MKTKKNTIQHLTILVVAISLIVIGILLANSNFDFVNFVMDLH